MEMKEVIGGVQRHVLTPAAKGAVEALLASFTAPSRKGSGGKLLQTLALIGIGAAIGAGTVLLLAPAPGKEIRARLMALFSEDRPSEQTPEEPAAEAESDAASAETPKPAAAVTNHNRRHRASNTPTT